MRARSHPTLFAGIVVLSGAAVGETAAQAPLPAKALYVAPGPQSGDGSADHPYNLIQTAVSNASPGTIILVGPGNYRENIKIPKSRGGTEAAPIWLIARSGRGSVRITPPDPKRPAITGWGVDNYVIRDFNIIGGYNGIQFNQSGRDFSDMVNNIVIEGNTISGVVQDGIKVGQADRVRVIGNTVSNTQKEEGIDFVAVNNGLIQANDVSMIRSKAAGIFAKGGSTNVKILNNFVHDVTGDGISAGGNTDETSFKPDFKGYEAKNILVSGNRVERVGKQPVSVRGAVDVVIRENLMSGNPKRGVGVYVTRGNPKASKLAFTSNVSITRNIFKNIKTKLVIDDGNSDHVSESQNRAGAWSGRAGIRAWTPSPIPKP